MKTRSLSLPLVILAAFFGGNSVFAQNEVQSPLFAYLDKIPESPAFPDDATLLSTPPTHFEELSDLNALEKNLQKIAKVSSNEIRMEFAKDKTLPGSEEAHENDKANLKLLGEGMLLKLKDMQAVKIEFEENFRRLENIYKKNVDKVYEESRLLLKQNPCNGNNDCLSEHSRLLNSGIIAASRAKISGEEYLLSVYLARIKPSFKSLDGFLQSEEYRNQAASKEIKNLFHGAQQDEVLLLTEIIERLKLERITISNSARLAQQFQKK